MALKDWKKVGEMTWQNVRGAIIKIEMGRGLKWVVIEIHIMSRDLLFKSGTKSLALKFAKSYMRTH